MAGIVTMQRMTLKTFSALAFLESSPLISAIWVTLTAIGAQAARLVT